MPKRGRPALSPEQKAANKAQREAAKAVNDWDARLPQEPERRSEMVGEVLAKIDRLKTAVKKARDDIHIPSEMKRLESVFGYRKRALKIMLIMEGCKTPEEQTDVWKQILMMAEDRNWLSAPGFDFPRWYETIGKSAPDEGSIFDKTGTGEKQAAERGDDPGRANKRKGKNGGPPPAPVDTGKLEPEEAVKAFTAANEKSGRFQGLGPDAIH